MVTLSHASDQPVTAHVATLDGTATTADADYLALSASLTIPAFATTDTVRVTVNGDLRCEPDEQFRVVLSSLVGAAAADTEATGTIVNDDDCTAVNGPADEFALAGIAPNPTAGATRVEYSLRSEARVRLTIVDLQGRTLAVLVDGVEPAGRHAERWSAVGPHGVASAGVYFARLEAVGRVWARRFAVTR